MNEDILPVVQNPIEPKKEKSYTLWILVALIAVVIAASFSFIYFMPAKTENTTNDQNTAITSTTDLDKVSQELDQTDLESYDSELDQNSSDASGF